MRRAEDIRGDVEAAIDAPEGLGAFIEQARPFAERAGSLAVWPASLAARVGATQGDHLVNC